MRAKYIIFELACSDYEFLMHFTFRRQNLILLLFVNISMNYKLHPMDEFVCLLCSGSVNQCISIYDLKGSPLNTIKFHEGFIMGARIGPVSCLTFHPLRYCPKNFALYLCT